MKANVRVLAGLVLLVMSPCTWSEDTPAANSPTKSDSIKPPFGLNWGETPERVEKLLHNAKAEIVEKTNQGGEQVFHVKGLMQTGLKQTVFGFGNKGLSRLTLQYQRADWEPARYEKFYEEVESRLSTKFPGGEEVLPEQSSNVLSEKQWKKGSAQIVVRLLKAESAGGPADERCVEVCYLNH